MQGAKWAASGLHWPVGQAAKCHQPAAGAGAARGLAARLKCCANFICKLWQKRGLYANLDPTRTPALALAWLWSTAFDGVAAAAALPQFTILHLTLFLMMCSPNAYAKYLGNAASLQLTVYCCCCCCCSSSSTVWLLSCAKVWNFDATSKQFFASLCKICGSELQPSLPGSTFHQPLTLPKTSSVNDFWIHHAGLFWAQTHNIHKHKFMHSTVANLSSLYVCIFFIFWGNCHMKICCGVLIRTATYNGRLFSFHFYYLFYFHLFFVAKKILYMVLNFHDIFGPCFICGFWYK